MRDDFDKKNIAIIIDNNSEIFLKEEAVIEYSVQTFYETKKFDDIMILQKEEVLQIVKKLRNQNCNIIIHDGNYPFITKDDVENLLENINCDKVLASKVTNTIKVCDENNIVKSTLDRSVLWSIKPTYSCNFNEINDFDNMKVVETNSFNIPIISSEDVGVGESILDMIFGK